MEKGGSEGLREREREGRRESERRGIEGRGSLGGLACIRVSGCVRLLYGCVCAIV